MSHMSRARETPVFGGDRRAETQSGSIVSELSHQTVLPERARGATGRAVTSHQSFQPSLKSPEVKSSLKYCCR